MFKKILKVTSIAVTTLVTTFIYFRNPLNNQPIKQTDTTWKSYKFEKIGLSFSAPIDMQVSEGSSDDNTFTFSIQRSAYPDPKYYQLYASLHPTDNLDKDTAGIKSQLIDGSKDKVIGGFKAIQGQYKGDRNRHVTFIFTDKGILTLATSQPAIENEEITNSILDTFSFTSTTATAIQASFAKKYFEQLNDVKVTVNKEVPGYATGSVSFGKGGPEESGLWIAVFGNGWEVVWDGNGSIDCNKLRLKFGIPDSILKPNFCE